MVLQEIPPVLVVLGAILMVLKLQIIGVLLEEHKHKAATVGHIVVVLAYLLARVASD